VKVYTRALTAYIQSEKVNSEYVESKNFRLRHTFQEWTAPKSLEIDQDNLRMKFSALHVHLNSVSFDIIGSRSPPYEGVKFGHPLQNARFLLISTNLARERLQIDTDLLLIITSTADELSGGTNIDNLERPWNPKIRCFSEFLLRFQAATQWKSEYSPTLLEIDQDNLRMKLSWCCRACHEHYLGFLVFL